MKKSMLALAALTAFAGAASAQSSVTIAGILDVNVRSVKNGSRELTTLSTDGLQSSRLIFRGVEDLGGGLKASFWLEGSVNVDTGSGQKTAAVGPTGNGAGGQDWQRRSTVSLAGNFGEIRLGRDYTPTFWNHTLFDPYNTVGVGSNTNLHNAAGNGPVNSMATTFTRANNTIGYHLPSGLGGLYGQLMAAAGEGTTGNEYYGGRIGYAAGPLNVAVAYGVTQKDGLMIDDLKTVNVGGSFNLGFLTLYGVYENVKYSSNKQDNYMIAAVVPFGASSFKFSYGEAKKFRDAKQYAFGYQYDLSKRTALYANYSEVDNERNSNYTASNGGKALNPTDFGFKSKGAEFGIRHSF